MSAWAVEAALNGLTYEQNKLPSDNKLPRSLGKSSRKQAATNA